MDTRAIGLLLSVGFLACGAPKPAENPSDAKTDEPRGDESPPPPPSHVNAAEPPKRSGNEYDKEATEVTLKRAARQVKEHCGDAKDESGASTGPWGKLTIAVMLGRNGHSKSVTVPSTHADKATGKCIVQAFSNLTFPPWAGQDTEVQWEVELVRPEAPPPPKKK